MTADDSDEEIHVLIEDPDLSAGYPRYVPDDPLEIARRAAYLEMLKKETGEDRSLLDMIAPRQTPKEWLQSLTMVDFADPSAVVSLLLDLATNNVPHFDLVTNINRQFSLPVPSAHPGLLCLEFTSQSSIFAALDEGETPKPSAACIPLPSVVLPIGQLQKRYKNTGGIPYSVDTEYVLVVDAIADKNPLWLIFDRRIRSHEEDGAYVKPHMVPLVFSRTERNFDAAQVLPSVQDWIKSYGTLDLAQIRDSFQQTGMTGEIRARNVTSADLPASWR
ncbi:uncharacterized protein FTJAE_629 [Fusarium tjaetaba]|uniref:Uncharacterized protein n=1 Tax=Fusarium tjaetaba TaxID=1567544 RepID=A0A8H5SFQ9_9HYPO|nr:uncharacterized protein FTJAE_629 [Fusarium tjaetaba]KAF5650205.1 hypothetical protein FTJAE_629 [Fusarium tjaetaba]